MKKILLLCCVFFWAYTCFAQSGVTGVPISGLPLYVGTPANGWLPITVGNITYRIDINAVKGTGGTGSAAAKIPRQATTSVPQPGFLPSDSLTADAWIREAFYKALPPTATLTGGQTLELMASGAALSYTLNWSAGRQNGSTPTDPLASIVVAGITQTLTVQPQPGNSNFGVQAVSVTRNTNVTYSNVVTTTGGQTATATTAFTFNAKRYFGWVSSSMPTDANIIAAGGEFSSSAQKSWTQSAPSGSQYLMFAYPSSFGDLTAFDINGFPSIEAMTLTKRTFVNASGYSQQYNIYVSSNSSNVTGTTTITTSTQGLQ